MNDLREWLVGVGKFMDSAPWRIPMMAWFTATMVLVILSLELLRLLK